MSRPVQSRQSENADPHEQYNPVPRVVILVILECYLDKMVLISSRIIGNIPSSLS